MFYEPGVTNHGLPHDPFKACVVPRPIGWISTISPLSRTGTRTANIAPFSQFTNLTFDPPYVMFAANHTNPGRHKDTVINAEATGVFCWQLATWPLRAHVNATAEFLPYGEDEFERAGGLAKTWSRTLDPAVPMVEASPVRFECRYHAKLSLPGNPPMGSVDVVIGRVVGVHIDESVLTDGKIDVTKTMPIARLGYYEYTIVEKTFEMIIPGDKALLYGLEGSAKGNRDAAGEAAGERVVEVEKVEKGQDTSPEEKPDGENRRTTISPMFQTPI